MKKIYTLIAAAFCVAASNAQILIQSNHAPAVGDMYQTVDCSTVGVNPGGNGTGQTWNYSTISVLSTTVTHNGVSVASTGSAAAYPSASVALSIGTGTNNFYSSSPTILQYWGGNVEMGGQQVTLTYTSPAIYATYPFSFGSTTNSTIGGSVTASPVGPGTFSGTGTVTATGTGMIMLPGGYNFNNILKVTTSQAMLANLPIGTATLTQNKYDYYSSLSRYPLFSITTSTLGTTFGVTTETMVTINNNYKTVGINESTTNVLSNVSVYPNPAKDHTNISFTNENAENASYQLVNVLGQSIRQQAIPSVKGETLFIVDLNGIESGIYFVKLTVGNKTSVTKITVQ
jgi:hypothetical protein